MEETPLPTKRAERKALKAPKLRSSDLVRRNLIHLFDSMAERPCFDYFDRLQAQVSGLIRLVPRQHYSWRRVLPHSATRSLIMTRGVEAQTHKIYAVKPVSCQADD